MSFEAAGEASRRALKERLLLGAGISVERFPALQAALEKMARNFTSGVQKLSGLPVEFFVESATSERAIDAHNALSHASVVTAYRVGDTDSRLMIAIDRAFIYLFLELMFGSDRPEPGYEDDRNLSKIETRVGRYACEDLARALTAGLSTTAGIDFSLERVEGKPEFSTGGRRNGHVLIYNCRLRASDLEGELSVIIPQLVIEPLRAVLSRDPLNETSSSDPDWAKRMKNRVTQADVTIRAVMEKRGLTLHDIACLDVGQIIPLPISPTGLIKLECESQALFWCTLGQKDEAYTIRVEDFIDKNDEFIDDVLGG